MSRPDVYRYSEQSVDACRAMIDALLLALGVQLKCDDMLHLSVTYQDESLYGKLNRFFGIDEIPGELKTIDGTFDKRRAIAVARRVADGDAIKPEWMGLLEEKLDTERDENDYPFHDTLMRIAPREVRYAGLAKLVTEFLYSVDYVGFNDEL